MLVLGLNLLIETHIHIRTSLEFGIRVYILYNVQKEFGAV